MGISLSPGMASSEGASRLGRDSAYAASWIRLVAPWASRMIAIPITIWSSFIRTQRTTMISAPAAPAPAPASMPSHSEPVL